MDEAATLRALDAIGRLFRATAVLTTQPTNETPRIEAAQPASRAGAILDAAELGTHHKVAHALGGRLGLPHAALHAVLLPHFLEHLRTASPDMFDRIVDVIPASDPPAAIIDFLARVGAPTSIAALGPRWSEVEDALEPHGDEETLRWVRAAFVGRRPDIDGA
jgi:alcohol dehydrogenase class IV